MPFPLILFSVSILSLAYASWTDFRERIVPNKLTYALVGAGFLLNGVFSLLTQNPDFILFSVSAAVYTFVLSYGLYRIGAWAGGDVKLFTGLAALNPTNPFVLGFLGFSHPLMEPVMLPVFPVALFIFSLLSMFPVAVFVTFKRAFRNKKMFLLLARDLALLLVFAVMLVFSFSTEFKLTLVPLLLLPMLYFMLSLLLSSRVFLKKSIKISEMEEGMIPAERIVLRDGKAQRIYPSGMKSFINNIKHNSLAGKDGKVVADYILARGVTESELEELKKLVREKKLKDSITVKESAPMVPAILVGYVLLNVTGDLLWHVMGFA